MTDFKVIILQEGAIKPEFLIKTIKLKAVQGFKAFSFRLMRNQLDQNCN